MAVVWQQRHGMTYCSNVVRTLTRQRIANEYLKSENGVSIMIAISRRNGERIINNQHGIMAAKAGVITARNEKSGHQASA